MKFSSFAKQFRPDSGILQLMEDIGEAASSDRKIYMLGGGNPARIPKMEAIFREQMETMLAESTLFEDLIGGYDHPGGHQPFIASLCQQLNDTYGWQITPANVALTNGSQAGFGILFNLLSGTFEGSIFKKILLPLVPEYIGYADIGLGGNSIFHSFRPVIEKQGDRMFKYRVDFENLVVDESIGAICVSRPTNPTGNVITDQELQKLRGIARHQGIPLIIDGAYGLPFPSIVFREATPFWDENTILCLSLSKFGLPGVRTGIIIAHEALISIMRGSNAIFTLAPGSFGPWLTGKLVRAGKILSLSKEIVRPHYKKRSDAVINLIYQSMDDLPVRVHVSEGAIFLWLWFEGLPISSQTLYERLKRRGVMVIAGQHFFPGLDDNWQHRHECIRVSYAAADEDVQAGIAIIGEEVRRAWSNQ